MDDNPVKNPWLALGLCPSPQMMRRPELVEELIEAGARVMRKRLHPDRTGGDAEAFLTAEQARDALRNSLVRHAKAGELYEAVYHAENLREQMERHRAAAAKAVLETQRAEKLMEKEIRERRRVETDDARRRKRIETLEAELQKAREELEKQRVEAQASLARHQENIEEKLSEIENEKQRISDRFAALRDTLDEAGRTLGSTESEIKLLRRDNNEIEDKLRQTRNAVQRLIDKGTPYLSTAAAVLSSLTAGVFGYSVAAGNHAAVAITALTATIGLLAWNFTQTYEMLRKLNLAVWKENGESAGENG